MLGEEPREIGERRLDVLGRGLVVALDGDQDLPGLGTGRRPGALAPAPAAGVHDGRLVDEDHLSRVGVLDGAGAEVCEVLVPGGEAL